MSFIAGYLLKSEKPDPARVRQQLTDFHILAGDEPNSYVNDMLAIPSGHLLWKYRKTSHLHPAISTDGDSSLLTLGFHLTNGQGYSGRNLLERCRDKGPQILEHIEGEFVSIYCEGSTGALHIVNDRFASRPMFLLENGRGIYFSSNLVFLHYVIQEKPTIDLNGCLQLFSYGHTIGERTTTRSIKRIGPASHWIISPQAIIKKKYWVFEHRPDENLNPDRYCEKVFNAFKSAAQARAKLFGSGIVALSGGLDSRLLTGAMPIDSGFNAFTFVDSTEMTHTPEVNAASAVAEASGLKHTVKCLEHDHISTVARQVVRLTGGLIPLHHPAKVMKYISEMQQNHQFFLLGGAPGNNLSGSFIPSTRYLDPKNLKACLSHYRAKMNLGGWDQLKAYLSTVFRDEILESHLPESIKEMDESIDSVGGPTAAHRIAAWQMCSGFPAYSANSPIHNHPDVMEAFAHLDYTYCNLMAQLPATWLYNRTFYEYMIFTCLPEFRHITYANTGKTVIGNFQPIDLSTGPELFSSIWAYMRNKMGKSLILKQGLSRIKPLLNRCCRHEEVKAAPPFLYQAMKKDNHLLSHLVEMVHSIHDLRLIFDPDKCLKLTDSVKAGRKQTLSFHHDAELMGSLASMCYSAEAFYSN